ncbi:hypothetical protein FXF51_02215 [Nonomuraea sp. PA05]|uniref:hypothetical protein n=1 Tax=Nonomuraea sp. PA05 TaxID=2604466 RepID=UPI0011D37929|nr:hypothetical protein [Nonomuraea sp. PA05]TYB71270.1 hypothetical protein FXF51_02215 [Nonomuraea sp. PA05]
MTRTSSSPPYNIAELFPTMKAYARTAVRLHPRPGEPNIHDSHIGGPLIWPADEPWPTCDRTIALPDDDWKHRIPESPVPMVGVAQLYARNIPEITFPNGTDLLQVLWCPNEHLLEDNHVPFLQLIWRRISDLTGYLDDPPMRHHETPDSPPDAPASELSLEYYLPRPCLLNLERVTEYPHSATLPQQLQAALKRWDNEAGVMYQSLLSVAPGCKIGGWESWHLTDKYELPCHVCGAETKFLMAFASKEWDSESRLRWQPLEERHLEPGTVSYEEAHEPTTLELGRYGALYLFVCPHSPDHGYRFTIQ